MLVIRLFRTGKKNQPTFKIVVTDKRKPPRGGRFVEEVGFYNPLKKEKVLKAERVKYWISVGAKPSPTVFNLLVSEKIIEGKKIPVHKKAKKKEETASAPAGATASQGEKPIEAPVEKPKETVVAAAPVPAPAKEDVPADLSAEAQGAKEEAKEGKPKEESPKPAKENKEKAPKETPKEKPKPEEAK